MRRYQVLEIELVVSENGPREVGRSAMRASGDLTDRLTKLQARMAENARRSDRLLHESRRLRNHSREVLERCHELSGSISRQPAGGRPSPDGP